MKTLTISFQCQHCERLTGYELQYEPGDTEEVVRLPCHACDKGGFEARVPGVHVKGMDYVCVMEGAKKEYDGTVS